MWGIGSLTAISQDEGGLGLGLALLGGIHIASAVSGNRAADRCKNARVEHDAWLQAANIGGKSREASRRAGSRSGPCYDDGGCDEGLRCHPEGEVCVLDDRALDDRLSAKRAGAEPEPPPSPEPVAEPAPSAKIPPPPAPAKPPATKTKTKTKTKTGTGTEGDYSEFWREVSP